jgi:hypothetical protein
MVACQIAASSASVYPVRSVAPADMGRSATRLLDLPALFPAKRGAGMGHHTSAIAVFSGLASSSSASTAFSRNRAAGRFSQIVQENRIARSASAA